MDEQKTIARVFKPNPVGRPGESVSGVIHQCDWCGAKDFWHARWSWFGSYRDEEDGKVVKCCGCCKPSEREAEDKLREKHGVNRKRKP